MPEWLLILLFFAVFGGVSYLAYRIGHTRGYTSGTADSLEISHQLDDILRGGPRG
ncbi:MAG: hypothetical protein JWP58_1069 [Hymenobacter sp.]|nr:hypothetical protein [Hymenobacter sp.]